MRILSQSSRIMIQIMIASDHAQAIRTASSRSWVYQWFAHIDDNNDATYTLAVVPP